MRYEEVTAPLREELALAGSRHGRWHSRYLGLAYRGAIGAAMARAGTGRPRVLKTDLWNECLAGDRDIVVHLGDENGCRVVALDLEYAICALGRTRVPGALVVQADIRALPFRPGSFDAVLDLSTLDHVPAEDVAAALAEYGAVLRSPGVLLTVFWQLSAVVRVRLLLKRLLRRAEKPGQRYFPRALVRAGLGRDAVIDREFAAGLLLAPPHRLTSALLGALPDRALTRLLRGVVRLEHVRALRPLLEHFAGLYGVVAVVRRR